MRQCILEPKISTFDAKEQWCLKFSNTLKIMKIKYKYNYLIEELNRINYRYGRHILYANVDLAIKVMKDTLENYVIQI